MFFDIVDCTTLKRNLEKDTSERVKLTLVGGLAKRDLLERAQLFVERTIVSLYATAFAVHYTLIYTKNLITF